MYFWAIGPVIEITDVMGVGRTGWSICRWHLMVRSQPYNLDSLNKKKKAILIVENLIFLLPKLVSETPRTESFPGGKVRW